jgi:hypothetical protein
LYLLVPNSSIPLIPLDNSCNGPREKDDNDDNLADGPAEIFVRAAEKNGVMSPGFTGIGGGAELEDKFSKRLMLELDTFVGFEIETVNTFYHNLFVSHLKMQKRLHPSVVLPKPVHRNHQQEDRQQRHRQIKEPVDAVAADQKTDKEEPGGHQKDGGFPFVLPKAEVGDLGYRFGIHINN